MPSNIRAAFRRDDKAADKILQYRRTGFKARERRKQPADWMWKSSKYMPHTGAKQRAKGAAQ